MTLVISQYGKKVWSFPTHACRIAKNIQEQAMEIATRLRLEGKLTRGYFNLFLVEMTGSDIPDDLENVTVDKATVDTTVEHIW